MTLKIKLYKLCHFSVQKKQTVQLQKFVFLTPITSLMANIINLQHGLAFLVACDVMFSSVGRKNSDESFEFKPCLLLLSGILAEVTLTFKRKMDFISLSVAQADENYFVCK